MQYTSTYPVPMEQERLAIALGLFRPAAPPTDAQRMEAAQRVEGLDFMKRTAYWMELQDIIERDLPPEAAKRPYGGQTAQRVDRYTAKRNKSHQKPKKRINYEITIKIRQYATT